MAKVLITGAAGFLGSHLCDRFISAGHHVVAMDNLLTGSLDNIEHLFAHKHFQFYHHDVSSFVHVPGQLDYILHFASPASPIDYLKMPIQTLKVGSPGHAITFWAWPRRRMHESWWLQRPRSMEIPKSTRNPKRIGVMSIPLVQEVSTMRPSAFRRLSLWPITPITSLTHGL